MDEAVEQVEERLLGPMEIVDQDRDGSRSNELVEELDPCLVQALARSQRVEFRRDLEARFRDYRQDGRIRLRWSVVYYAATR